MVLGRGGEHHRICAEQVLDEEHGQHDPVGGMAQKEANGAAPQNIWVHLICLEHSVTPEEVGGPWPQDDLYRL
jgi:hypothetical protein